MFRLRALTAIFLAMIAGGSAMGIEIKEKRWGFDGRVRAGRFNILSVLVTNPDARAFAGEFVLEDRRGMEKSVGAPVVQPMYLAAGTLRWVQFHVFTNQAGGEWDLRWGKGPRDHEKIDGAQYAAPARVLLIDQESAFASTSGLRAFPDDLFPTTVAATDALDAVALDHVPRWEPVRREAFLDWLRRGGTVHLLHAADGQFPNFPEPLAALNAIAERTRFGAGLIVRHDATRAQMNEQFLADHGFPAPELRTNAKVQIYDLEMLLLQKLAALTKPKIAWWMIYLLTAGYVAVVGPVHYRWSKRLPWRRSIALLLAVVAGFGGAFAFAGRRGANETQQIRALAIAHSLGEGRHDVTQWISAFATRGNTYKLSHASPSNLYSTATAFDSVNGTIVNGRDGRFEVDIPLFSTRPFVHRGVLQGDRTEIAVVDWQTKEGGSLEKLVLKSSAELSKKVEHAWVRHRNVFHEMTSSAEGWQLAENGDVSESEFFSEQYFHQIIQNLYDYSSGVFVTGPGGEKEEKPDDAWLHDAGKLLIARALGTVEGLQHVVTGPPPPADRVQLFLYAPLPDGFRVLDPRFGNQTGRVLYVQDVFKP